LPYCKIQSNDKVLQILLADHASIEQLNKDCMNNGITLNHIVKRKKSLETKFMEITK
jgi:hypothetical protein